MSDPQEKIANLEARIDRLIRTQIDFQSEINAIRAELRRLRSEDSSHNEPEQPTEPQSWQASSHTQAPPPPSVTAERPSETPRDTPPPSFGMPREARWQYSEPEREPGFAQKYFEEHSQNARANLEKFIGENLISKIGIIVLIIGVGIGVKYSIDNNLISPAARIAVGYLFGFGLAGLAIWLKRKYHNFSAALLSGGMAILYFVTYFAYSAYELMPQGAAFGLMALFTLLTVAAALFYNRQVIAHIGLVGAYAVPFLLSTGSANYLFLFTYMAVINAGILAVSVMRYWSAIFYTSSLLTWLIYFAWFAARYSPDEHLGLALTFLGIFFALFFTARIAQTIKYGAGNQVENRVSATFTAAIFFLLLWGISVWSGALGPERWAIFTFLAGFTAAILLLSLRWYGKEMLYLCFAAAWLIFASWFNTQYEPQTGLAIGAVFSSVIFLIFYAGVLVHRLRDERFRLVEIAGLILTNAFAFYGFGYAMIDGLESGDRFLGIFTVGHAAFHFAVAAAVSRRREDAVDLVQLLTILTITFVTIAVPVHFDGNFVTVIWAVEAALLFWFGRARSIPIYEYFSVPVFILALGSQILDWMVAVGDRTLAVSELNRVPLANGAFISALLVVAAAAFIWFTDRERKASSAFPEDIAGYFGYAVAGAGLLFLYITFGVEIGHYFHLQAVAAATENIPGSSIADTERMNIVWQINYTLAFAGAMLIAAIVRMRSRALAWAGAVVGVFALIAFLTAGMLQFFELRDSYLLARANTGAGPMMNLLVRYFSYAVVALLIYIKYRFVSDEDLSGDLRSEERYFTFEAGVVVTLFITASCELLHLMAQAGIDDGAKLGLSILWGVFALAMIVAGIARGKRHLRLAAIALVGVTLIKLFFYDIAELGTIPKTILFVTLGVTLLLISFLYNKYKNAIFGTRPDEEAEAEEV